MKTKMEQFPAKNPNPVLRVGKDGYVLYSNVAGKILLKKWGVELGEKIPSNIGDFVQKVIFLNSPEKMEVKVGKKTYLVAFHPLQEEDYVNIYGFDISSQKELEEKLRSKEKQHDVLYKLGRVALTCENLQAFMDESVKMVASTLKLEYCKILELMPDGNFLLRAGVGWKPGLVGKAVVDGKKKSQAGYTLLSKGPVIVADFQEEKRFKSPLILQDHNVISGMSVIIGSMEKPFGVLGAHSTKKRRFTGEESYFLNSVAFLLAEIAKRKRIEMELEQHREQLEELVRERTSELTKANEQLTQEIAGRNQVEKALQNNVNFLEAVLNAMPGPIFYRDLNKIYQGCNEKFAKHVLGLPKEEVIGHSMYDFNSVFREEMVQESEDHDKILLEGGQSSPHEITARCAGDGKLRDFLLHKATYRNTTGEIISIVGVSIDITKRKKAEEALLETEKIRKKEIHHRIKNNLQVISSLLSLQADNFNDKKVKEAFKDSQNRVKSMSLIHEELYKTETGDLETFDFKSYIQKLSNELFHLYVTKKEDIRLKLDMENASLCMDTGIPLGIIVNELVSNSLKHAFPERRRSGEVQIRLHRLSRPQKKDFTSHHSNKCETPDFLLEVSDNGIGFPENIDFKHSSSLGLQLVTILVEQLEGCIELKKENGTQFRIFFREKASLEKKETDKE